MSSRNGAALHCTQNCKVRKQIALIVAAGVVAVSPIPPAAVDRLYSSGVYLACQAAVTTASNLVPVAFLDFLMSGVLLAWIVVAIRDFRHPARRLRAAFRILVRTAAWAAALYLFFVVAWGLNYRRLRLADKLPFDASAVTADAARAAGLVTVGN